MNGHQERTRPEQLELETLLLSRYLIPLRHPAAARVLERSWYLLLSRIAVDGPLSIGELSHALLLDVSTLNRQTAALTKAGYLERVADPDGGLARKFRMTEAGSEALAQDRRANVDGITKVLSDWDDADIDRFTELIRKFTDSIETRARTVWPRD